MSSAPRSAVVRRAAYRVRPESIEEIDLAVLEKRYKVVRGYVADVACGGVQVQFRRDKVPALKHDEPCLLAVASDRYDFDATLRAKIVSTVEHANGPLFRFAFEPENEALRTDRADLFQLFNRRAAYRRPERRRAPAARVVPGDGDADTARSVVVTIRNVSACGVSFASTARDARLLGDCCTLMMRLALPGFGAEDVMACRIRRRSDGGNVFGCEFDWNLTAHAEATSKRISSYVIARLAADQRLSPDRRCRLV